MMIDDDMIDPLYAADVKITPAVLSLQKKAGTGDIDPELIKKADQFIQNNDVDFTPLAHELLARLEETLTKIKNASKYSRFDLLDLQGPVMQLKANGKMFKYDLISALAAILLDFLETIEAIDDDVLALVGFQLSGSKVILATKMTGTGGLDGMRLRSELEEACQRYYRKNPNAKKHL